MTMSHQICQYWLTYSNISDITAILCSEDLWACFPWKDTGRTFPSGRLRPRSRYEGCMADH